MNSVTSLSSPNQIAQLNRLKTALTNVEQFAQASLATLKGESPKAPVDGSPRTYNVLFYYEQPHPFVSLCRIFTRPSVIVLPTRADNSATTTTSSSTTTTTSDGRTTSNTTTARTTTRKDNNSDEKDDKTSGAALVLMGIAMAAIMGIGAHFLGKNAAALEGNLDEEAIIKNYKWLASNYRFLRLDGSYTLDVTDKASKLVNSYKSRLRQQNIALKVMVGCAAVVFIALFAENEVAYFARKVGCVGIAGSVAVMIYNAAFEKGSQARLMRESQEVIQAVGTLRKHIESREAKLLAPPPYQSVGGQVPPQPSAPAYNPKDV
jgi:hypothetical protein